MLFWRCGWVKVHMKSLYLYYKGICLTYIASLMFRKISIIVLLGFVSLFSFCKKKNKTVQDNIAYQTVNITIYPNDPLYFKLQTPVCIMWLTLFRTTLSPKDFFMFLNSIISPPKGCLVVKICNCFLVWSFFVYISSIFNSPFRGRRGL